MRQNEGCPYQDKPCPKLDEIKSIANANNEEVRQLKADVKTLLKIVYVMIGLIFVEYGVTLW